MMKLYTRGGDKGQTSLFGGERVAKNAPRIAAYGEVDELNAVIGWCATQADSELAQILLRESAQLFTLGSHFATPPSERAKLKLPAWDESSSSALEAEIDQWTEELPPLKSFILPTGCELSCRLHIARTVCRRAERHLVALDCAEDAAFVIYLNRLSDWLFCLARLANHRAGTVEQPWLAE